MFHIFWKCPSMILNNEKCSFFNMCLTCFSPFGSRFSPISPISIPISIALWDDPAENECESSLNWLFAGLMTIQGPEGVTVTDVGELMIVGFRWITWEIAGYCRFIMVYRFIFVPFSFLLNIAYFSKGVPHFWTWQARAQGARPSFSRPMWWGALATRWRTGMENGWFVICTHSTESP